jgi:hypothetical protein
MIRVNELKDRDPRAWSHLLAQDPDTKGPIVTAVEQEPISIPSPGTRYFLSLAGHPEPITLLAKETNAAEARFYRDISPFLESFTPNCWFSHVAGDNGWIVVDEAYDDWPPEKWTPTDVDGILERMTLLHASYWNREQDLLEMGVSLNFEQKAAIVASEISRRSNESFLGDPQPEANDRRIGPKGEPDSLVSDHALRVSGHLAPVLTNAASGLEAIQSVGGWPGILDEQELSALADLIDDPLPMLFPLRQLPKTLLHGVPSPSNWRLSMFGDYRLINWEKISVGPAVCDLVQFIDRFDGFSVIDVDWRRPDNWPVTEETMEDSYILAMGRELGTKFNATTFRQAIPAARCLYVLTNWLPMIDTWFRQLPCEKEIWLNQNQMSDDELAAEGFGEMVNLRPYMSRIFDRWMTAYRSL